MSDFYRDTFVGPGGTLLSAHTPDVGSAYSNSGGGDPKLDGSNRAESGTDQGICWQTTTPPGADYIVEAIVDHLTFAADQNWHIIARGNSGSGDRYALVLNAFRSPSTLHLSRFDGGGETVIGETPFTPTAGQEYTFQIRCVGTTISAWRDGSQILSGTDSALSAAGLAGLVLQGANTESTGLRFVQARGFVASATTFSASVPTTGEGVNLSFTASVSGIAASEFVVSCGGVALPILNLSGSGTSWKINLRLSRVTKTLPVVVTYTGSIIVAQSITATNNSTVSAQLAYYATLGQGTFIHFSAATWGVSGTVTQAVMNAVFNPTSLNIDQWLDTCVSMGSRYVVFTTKHDQGFCMWPTLSGTINSSATPWGVSTGIDIVSVFVSKCRARGLKVGLYFNFYDPWYTGIRPGHDGTYGPPATFTAYCAMQFTELLSNYGVIDIFWVDSWAYRPEIGYVNANYAELRALVTTLQPNCIFINNNSELDLTHTDVYSLEGPPSVPPPSSNVLPAEFHTTVTADGDWVWNPTNNGACEDPVAVASELALCFVGRCNFLVNIPPNTSGLMPDLTVAFASAYGAVAGRQGPTLLPIPSNVKSGVDRGDGMLGTFVGSGGGGDTDVVLVGNRFYEYDANLKTFVYVPAGVCEEQ